MITNIYYYDSSYDPPVSEFVQSKLRRKGRHLIRVIKYLNNIPSHHLMDTDMCNAGSFGFSFEQHKIFYKFCFQIPNGQGKL